MHWRCSDEELLLLVHGELGLFHALWTRIRSAFNADNRERLARFQRVSLALEGGYGSGRNSAFRFFAAIALTRVLVFALAGIAIAGSVVVNRVVSDRRNSSMVPVRVPEVAEASSNVDPIGSESIRPRTHHVPTTNVEPK
jgi:hypothetical protein